MQAPCSNHLVCCVCRDVYSLWHGYPPLPVPTKGGRMPFCQVVSHTQRRRNSLQTSSSCHPSATLVTSLPATSFHFPELVLVFGFLDFLTDHIDIYLQQKAYDLSFVFTGHGKDIAERSWKGLRLMGSPVTDRRAGQCRNRGLSLTQRAQTLVPGEGWAGNVSHEKQPRQSLAESKSKVQGP